MARLAGILVVIAFGAILARQIVEFRDPFAPLEEDVRLLLSTDWGTAWRWGSAASMVAFVGLWLAGVRSSGVATLGWLVGGLALIATGAYPAFTGHAASGSPVWLTIPADVVHVWAASAWIGGLGMLVVALRVSAGGAGSAAPTLVAAFSPVALVSVVALLVTGTIANWQLLDSPAALVSTAWGRILGVKLLLVAGVLLLGARNWRVLSGRLGSTDGDRAMRRSATLELVLGHLALIATAVLVRTSPG